MTVSVTNEKHNATSTLLSPHTAYWLIKANSLHAISCTILMLL